MKETEAKQYELISTVRTKPLKTLGADDAEAK